jgi:dTMP kinase
VIHVLNQRVQGGYIVTIEGIDAVGKNTHSLLLSAWLRRRGVKTIHMSFPDYGTPIGKEIKSFLSGRRDYPTELQHILFAANRWEKSDKIKSYLQAGTTIIVNRYTESNLAYGRANGLDVGWLSNLEEGLPKSNLVVVLDASPRVLNARRPHSIKDSYEKSSALQTKAQKAYRELARRSGWKLIDADESVGEVQALVVKTVKEALARDRYTAI